MALFRALGYPQLHPNKSLHVPRDVPAHSDRSDRRLHEASQRAASLRRSGARGRWSRSRSRSSSAASGGAGEVALVVEGRFQDHSHIDIYIIVL